jgi:hypothetical protein
MMPWNLADHRLWRNRFWRLDVVAGDATCGPGVLKILEAMSRATG